MNVVLSELPTNVARFGQENCAFDQGMCDCDDSGGFGQILQGRGALAASLQAPDDTDTGQCGAGSAVAFADVALLQAGVAVQSQAVGYVGEAGALGTAAIAAGTTSSPGPAFPGSIPAASFAMADSLAPESSLAAADGYQTASLLARQGQLLPGAMVAASTVASWGPAADMALSGSIAGASLAFTGLLVAPGRAAKPGPAGAPHTFQRPLPNLPVVLSLSAEAGEAALAVRADGMSEPDQAEFERRTREELALSGRQLRQLRINGHERPITGVV